MILGFGILTTVSEIEEVYGDFESFDVEINEEGYNYCQNNDQVFIYCELCFERIKYGEQYSVLDFDLFDYDESRTNLEYYINIFDTDVKFVCFHEEKEQESYLDGKISKSVIQELGNLELSDESEGEDVEGEGSEENDEGDNEENQEERETSEEKVAVKNNSVDNDNPEETGN